MRIFFARKRKNDCSQSVPGERLDWKVQQGILPLCVCAFNARGIKMDSLSSTAAVLWNSC